MGSTAQLSFDRHLKDEEKFIAHMLTVPSLGADPEKRISKEEEEKLRKLSDEKPDAPIF